MLMKGKAPHPFGAPKLGLRWCCLSRLEKIQVD